MGRRTEVLGLAKDYFLQKEMLQTMEEDIIRMIVEEKMTGLISVNWRRLYKEVQHHEESQRRTR